MPRGARRGKFDFRESIDEGRPHEHPDLVSKVYLIHL